MSQHPLPAHGLISAPNCIGNIIYLSAEGPWNREAVIAYRDLMAPIAASMDHKPWGILAHVRGEAFLLPEAVDVVRKGAKSDREHGRVATAFVFDDVKLPSLAEELFSRVYQGTLQDFQFFTDKKTAETWLKNAIEQHQIVSH